MRRLFFVLAFLLSIEASAQCPKFPQWINSYYNYYGLKDSVLFQLPRKSPLVSCRDTGMTYYNVGDEKLHWWTGATDTTFSGAIPSWDQTLQVNDTTTRQYVSRATSTSYTISSIVPLNYNPADSIGLWGTYLNDFNVNPGQRHNVAYSQGYNTSGGGNPQIVGEASFRFAQESAFHMGQWLFEFHSPEVVDTVGNFHRLFSIYCNKNDGMSFLQSQINNLSFRNFNSQLDEWLTEGRDTLTGNSTMFLIGDQTKPNAQGIFTMVGGSGPGIQITANASGNIINTGSAEDIWIANRFDLPRYCVFNQNNAQGDFNVHFNTGDSLTGRGFLLADMNDDPMATFKKGFSSINFPTVIGGAPDSSAILQCISTIRGFMPPQMTTLQKLAISGPNLREGIQVYDLTLHQMSYYNGTLWINF